MSKQWINKSIIQLCQAIECNEVDLETVVDAFYQRINDRDKNVQAWQLLISKEEYLKKYYLHKQFYKNSVLMGLPFAVKDVIDTAGIETCMGSNIYAHRVPTMDAAVVTAIKQAGGILIGKTVTTEFAFFKAGKTCNPHDRERTPGGSSSGSAAAVADYMVPFALGTQTAASVIRPASYCGCLAYVASHNEFSLRNIQPLAQSLDRLGMFAHHFSDISFMRKIMQLRSPENVEFPAIQNLKIAVFLSERLGEIDCAMQQAFSEFIARLKQNSIQLFDVPDEIDVKALEQHHIQIMAYEVARNLQFEYQTGMLDSFLTELIEQGLALTYFDYVQHLQAVEKIKTQYQEWMDVHQIMLTIAPAASGVAPLGLEKTGQPFMSRPWQVMGLPVTTFPIAYQQKLPLGVQLIGHFQQDDELLEISQLLQSLVEFA